MDEITKKVLISVRAFIDRLAQSEALSTHQVTEAQMASTVLAYELARLDYDPVALDKVLESERGLAAELARSLHSSEAATVPRKWRAGWEKGVGAALTAVIAADRRQGAKPEPETEARIARQLRDFLVSYHEPLDPAVGGGPRAAYKGGRSNSQGGEGRSIYITAPTLEAYLHGRFPDLSATRVQDVRRLMGGFSKETYIVKLEAPAGPSTMVIRKDGAGLPTGSSVVDEYKGILEVLPTGVPVPQPLWLEADPRHFGTAFMAVGFVEGEPAHLNLPDDPARRRKWADSFARNLALLHSRTRKRDVDVRDTMRADIAALQHRVEERERSPHPGIAFGLAWLTDHLDDLKGRPAVRVHGDVGFHNILMRDDAVKVLLDWEFSHYSDPVEDLSYVKQFMDEIGVWGPFLETYRENCGFSYDEAAARYFGVWKDVRNAVACIGSLNSLLLPEVKDVALALAGNVYIPKFEIGVLDSILTPEV